MKKNLFTVTVMLLLMVLSFIFGVRYDRSINDPVIDSLKEVSIRERYMRMKAVTSRDSAIQISEQVLMLYYAQKSETEAAISKANNAEAMYNSIRFRKLTDETRDSTLRKLYPGFYGMD